MVGGAAGREALAGWLRGGQGGSGVVVLLVVRREGLGGRGGEGVLEVGRVARAAHEEEGFDGVLLADIGVRRDEHGFGHGGAVRAARGEVGTGGVQACAGRGVVSTGEEGGDVAWVGLAAGIAQRRLGGLDGHGWSEAVGGLDGGC